MSGTFLERLTPQELEEINARAYDDSRPILVGFGPAEFSPSLAVDTFPSIVWDSNGYYRDLGLGVKASKTEIRDRYIELDGESSVRLTMIASVLLNDERRRKYDGTPLGSFFFDEEIESLIRSQIADENLGRCVIHDEDPEDDWLRDFDPTEEDISAFQAMLRHDATHALTNPRRDQWSFYVHGVVHHDAEKLAQWRAFLAMACYSSSIDPGPLAVGFVPGSGCVVARVGYRTVAFIGVQSDPSEVLAWEATRQLSQLTSSK